MTLTLESLLLPELFTFFCFSDPRLQSHRAAEAEQLLWRMQSHDPAADNGSFHCRGLTVSLELFLSVFSLRRTAAAVKRGHGLTWGLLFQRSRHAPPPLWAPHTNTPQCSVQDIETFLICCFCWASPQNKHTEFVWFRLSGRWIRLTLDPGSNPAANHGPDSLCKNDHSSQFNLWHIRLHKSRPEGTVSAQLAPNECNVTWCQRSANC